MSDLISRSKAISVLKQLDEHSLSGKMNISNAIYLLEKQPTAYDIDKVVEELEQKKEEVQRMRNTCVALSDLEVCDIENVTYERAIEIVKQGGVSDDVCEWQRDEHSENDNPAEWIICPHKPKRIFSKDIKYCPYCGKKIKAVE